MKKHYNRAVCLALLLLFSYSLLTLLISCLGCTVQRSFYLWTALLCVSTWYTTCTRHGMWIGLPLSAVLLFAASRYFPSDLSLQLNDVIDRLTGAYMEQIIYPGEAYSYLNGSADHSLLLLFLAFLLSSYMGAAISSRSGRIGLALLGSVPFFITCLAVSTAPSVLPVIGMVLFWFLLAIGGSHYDEDTNSYRRVLVSTLPLSLLLSLLLVYVNPAEYTYDPSHSPVRQMLDRLFQNIDSRFDELLNGERLSESDFLPPSAEIEDDDAQMIPDRTPMPWQNGRGDMDLTRAPDLSELETLFLRVRAELDGTLYLRAVSYGDYTGTGWSRTEEDAPVSSLPFTAESLSSAGIPAHSLSVQFVQQSAYRYLPYFSMEQLGFDSFVPPGILDRYSVHFSGFPKSFAGILIPAGLQDSELSYRAYAHEVYTRLPESTRQALLEICAQNGLSLDMQDPITQVAAFVQRTGSYDLETNSYASSDYALYFLTDARRGTCVHFATAATALYRCLGIPARITEGFLLEGKAGEPVDVKGYQAHAWVEIYQDGLGWLPVEVTGQSGLDSEALGAHDSSPSPEPAPDGAAPSPEPAEEPQSGMLPLPVGVITETEGASSTATASAVQHGLLCLLFLTAMIAALPLRRKLILLLRSRSFEQSDTRKAVIAMYKTAQKASIYGVELPELLVNTAERAAFSQHEICADEVEICRDKLFIMLKSCYLRQKPWKRFRFKYISALI